jgi:hypothetical protein
LLCPLASFVRCLLALFHFAYIHRKHASFELVVVGTGIGIALPLQQFTPYKRHQAANCPIVSRRI